MEAGTLPPGSPASHVAAQISATAGAGRGDTERVREGRAGGAGRGGTWGAGSPASPYPSARGAGRVRTAGRRRRRRGRWLGAGLLKDVFGESAGRKSGRQDSGAGESQGTILGTQRLGAIWMQPPSSLPLSLHSCIIYQHGSGPQRTHVPRGHREGSGVLGSLQVIQRRAPHIGGAQQIFLP